MNNSASLYVVVMLALIAFACLVVTMSANTLLELLKKFRVIPGDAEDYEKEMKGLRIGMFVAMTFLLALIGVMIALGQPADPPLLDRTYIVSFTYGDAGSSSVSSGRFGFASEKLVICGRKLQFDDLEQVRQRKIIEASASAPTGSPPQSVVLIAVIEAGERVVNSCSSKP